MLILVNEPHIHLLQWTHVDLIGFKRVLCMDSNPSKYRVTSLVGSGLITMWDLLFIYIFKNRKKTEGLYAKFGINFGPLQNW